jgi:hypothetical protein
MDRELVEQRRTALAEVEAELTAWRQQHPTATWQEIEYALDTRLAQVRADLLTDLAHASPAADWRTAASSDQPVCPDCGSPLHPRGKHPRQLTTHGGQTVTLKRQYGVCPGCGTGLFPPG